MDRRTDGQTDGRTDGLTGRQAGRHALLKYHAPLIIRLLSVHLSVYILTHTCCLTLNMAISKHEVIHIMMLRGMTIV